MNPKLITIKQCDNPAEAAFFASYLEENGVHAVNTAETMGAWTGRYSLLSRGPLLRVETKDSAKARRLLQNPPAPLEADIEADFTPSMPAYTPGGILTQCPLCGSGNIAALSGNTALIWFLSLIFFGVYEPTTDPMWVCRDCDWDSKRKSQNPP